MWDKAPEAEALGVLFVISQLVVRVDQQHHIQPNCKTNNVTQHGN